MSRIKLLVFSMSIKRGMEVRFSKAGTRGFSRRFAVFRRPRRGKPLASRVTRASLVSFEAVLGCHATLAPNGERCVTSKKKTPAKETTASLAVETKGLLFMWLAQLNNKSNADIFPIGFDNS